MSLTADERRVLLAAAASPLERISGQWYRTDPPVALGAASDGEHRWARAETAVVESLIRRGLLELAARTWLSDAAVLTEAGDDETETLRSVLGRAKRRLLRQIDEAGELVRRERPATDEEYCEIIGCGGSPAEQIVEWVAPIADGPWARDRQPRAVCGVAELHDLRCRGLVILLAGGSRAVLTGAGRWCAVEIDHELDEAI